MDFDNYNAPMRVPYHNQYKGDVSVIHDHESKVHKVKNSLKDKLGEYGELWL